MVETQQLLGFAALGGGAYAVYSLLQDETANETANDLSRLNEMFQREVDDDVSDEDLLVHYQESKRTARKWYVGLSSSRKDSVDEAYGPPTEFYPELEGSGKDLDQRALESKLYALDITAQRHAQATSDEDALITLLKIGGVALLVGVVGYYLLKLFGGGGGGGGGVDVFLDKSPSERRSDLNRGPQEAYQPTDDPVENPWIDPDPVPPPDGSDEGQPADVVQGSDVAAVLPEEITSFIVGWIAMGTVGGATFLAYEGSANFLAQITDQSDDYWRQRPEITVATMLVLLSGAAAVLALTPWIGGAIAAGQMKLAEAAFGISFTIAAVDLPDIEEDIRDLLGIE